MSVKLRLALQEERATELSDRVRRLLGPFSGSEVALDSGSGTGSLAFALAAHVGEVVAVDTRTEFLSCSGARDDAGDHELGLDRIVIGS